MRKFSIIYTVLAIIQGMVFSTRLMAQSTENKAIDVAETFRSEGKIYVVVLVLGIVFTGLILYAANTDRKLSKIEKEIESLKSNKDS